MPLGDLSAIAAVHRHVLEAAGTLLREFRTTYHLVRADDGWRIVSYTNHDD